MSGTLIRGGTVVDGTGAAGFAADVRIENGTIVEVGPSLISRGETEIDAKGAFVTPGFIDSHTHLDGAMFWAPDLHPIPGYGTTTAVMGNCGITMAPLPPKLRREVLELFCYLEDLPVEAFEQHVPWGWDMSFGDYSRKARATPTSINLEGYVGHINLRACVMGEGAWDRIATPEERTQMAALLDDAMRNGSLGLSTNLMDNDQHHRPVPSRVADDDEFEALFDVLARYPSAIAQIEARFAEPDHFAADMERMASIAGPRGVRAVWLNLLTIARMPQLIEAGLALHKRIRDSGADFWPTFIHKPFAIFLNFDHSLMFEWMPAWHDMMYAPKNEREAILADPEWRAKARNDMDHHRGPPGYPFERPDIVMLSYSENGAGPVGISLGDYARDAGLHPSDAMAKWLQSNGLGSILSVVGDALDEVTISQLIRDPHTLACPNDTGAHLQLFEAAGQTIYLLTHYVRDTAQLSIEEAVHSITSKQAACFGLHDRGVIAPGRTADLNVFALNEIQLHPEEKAFDVPGGSWRFIRKPAGFRATLVKGTPIFLDGKATGERPGRAFTSRPSAH
ncbi:MAG: D-aminoacylase [Rhodospirillales bacterium]|nr:D-aminoacylase [Rhodospirillales bacterium]